MQGQSACRAGDPSGQGEDPPPEGLGGHDLLTQADAGCPAGQVVRHHLYRQPGAVGGEAARGEMVQPHAVLEVAYRILDLGVTAMIGLQFQHLPVPVGDEAVIAVSGEERLEEQLVGERQPTQVGRVLKELGIQSIVARSPQAKGRVGRLWGTFQDRLVSELRLAGAATVEEANQVLWEFLPQFNAGFTVPPAQAGSAYCPLEPGVCLEGIYASSTSARWLGTTR